MPLVVDRVDQAVLGRARGAHEVVTFGVALDGLEIHAQEILNIKARLNELLAYHTGQELETIKRDTERDNFMSASRAAEYGLIDSVYDKRQLVS